MNGDPDVDPREGGSDGAGWRLSVDPDRCIGSGICAGTAPRHFQVVGGVSRPLAELVEPDEIARDAADFCPVEAITVRDAATAKVLAPEP